MKICLDAGHGYKCGLPSGARCNGVIEDDIALALAHKVRWYLTKAGHEVVLTRRDEDFVPLENRGKIARKAECQIFVSIHVNASTKPEARGAETICADGDADSLDLAEELLDVMVKCGLKRRDVKWDCQSQHKSLRVLRDTCHWMRAVLLEIGFLTNKSDALKLQDKAWQDKLAAALAAAIA